MNHIIKICAVYVCVCAYAHMRACLCLHIVTCIPVCVQGGDGRDKFGHFGFYFHL